MGIPLKVLMVEDSDDDSLLILRELRRSGYDPAYTRVQTMVDMEAALNQQPWDLILSDYKLPQFSGLAALNTYQTHNLDIPFIIISGTIGEGTAVEMMKAGVHDYLMKDNLKRLGPAIERELRECEARRERHLAQEALRQSEEKFSKAFHISPDAISLNRLKDGVFLEINHGFTLMTGYRSEQITGTALGDSKIFTDPAILRSLKNELIQKGEVRNLELVCNTLYNTQFVGLTSARLIDLDGETCVLSITRDITERKRTEIELQKLNRALRMANESNQALIRATDEISLLQQICRIIVEIGGYEFAWIELIHNEKTPEMVAFYGQDQGFMPFVMTQNDLPSPIIESLQHRHQIVISDLKAEASPTPWIAQAVQCGFSSATALPLAFQDDLFGSLGILSTLDNHNPAAEKALLQELADDLGYGLHTLRLREENRHTSELLQKSNQDLAIAYDATLEGWSHALELRERETAGHSQRVVSWTLDLAKKLGIPLEELIHIRRGALLHDIGKMGIPDTILLKPGPLTEEEWIIMRQHPIYAHKLLSGIPYLRPALEIPYFHHERWDGSGYPQGLKGERIPLSARIFAVIDVWDALSSDRPYRPAWPPAAVKDYLRSQTGKQFDPSVVDAFLEIIADTPIE